MTGAGGAASLVWLTTSAHALADTWSALRACCSGVAEAILVGLPHVESVLASLPRAFPNQQVVACGAGETVAAALNRATGHARSPYLLFVTRDIAPEAGWLAPILHLLEADDAIGVTTPQLVGGDGRLVAAGSVVWADGTSEAFGVGSTTGTPACAFRREVPAVPSHAFVVRSSAFHAAGCFDAGYLSPEYAVADLCFSLRSRGLGAVYQPRASGRVDGSSGSPVEVLTADRRHFRARWERQLADFPHRLPDAVSPRQWLAARDALADERLLVVDDRVPAPDRGSGDPRMFAMLHEMLALWPGLRVTVAAMTDRDAARSAPRLQDSGIEVAYGEHWPWWFQQRLYHYGIVLMSRPQPPAVEEWIHGTQPQAFRIYDAEALVHRRLERMLPLVEETQRAALLEQVRDTRARETNYLATADEILCVSHEEQRVARAAAAAGTPVFVLPFCMDIAESPPAFTERRDLVYFGGFMAGPGSPNEDAVLYLAHDVLPLIRHRVPDVVLHVVGADPTPAVLALESPHVHVVGYVEDPRAWLDRVRIHVVPMRFGAGVKQKLVDTMAAGLPFVTTPVGAEGLRLGGLARLLVADDPAQLAELAVALYLDAERWTSAHQRLLRLARRHGRQQFRRTLGKAMVRAGLPPPVPGGSSRTTVAAAR